MRRGAATAWCAAVLGLVGSEDGAAVVRGAVVVAGIELHAVQISGMWTQNAQSVGRAVDGVLSAEAAGLREIEEAHAARAHEPVVGVCEGVEGFRGVRAARSVEATATGDGGAALVAWLSRDARELPGWTAPGDVRERFDEVHARFCAADRVRGGGPACTGPSEDHGADLHPGAVSGRSTFEDGAEAIAAIEWVRNITMPLPIEGPSLRAAGTTRERRAVLLARSQEARGALATGYLQGRVSARLPAVAAGPWARAVGAGVAEDGSRAEISVQGLLEALSRGRYERPGFFARLQAEGKANLLRELIVSEAAALVVGFEEFRDAERQGAMLAARLTRASEQGRRAR